MQLLPSPYIKMLGMSLKNENDSHFSLITSFCFTHFYVFFVNILKKVYFSDSKPSPTCYVPSSSYICDGFKNCDDNSDEIGCQCPGDSSNVTVTSLMMVVYGGGVDAYVNRLYVTATTTVVIGRMKSFV